MAKVTVYAEKFDVASKIAVAMTDFKFKGKALSMEELNAKKDAVTKEHKSKGFIEANCGSDTWFITWGSGHMCTLKSAKDYNPEYKSWKNIPFPFFPNYELKIVPGKNYKTGDKTDVDIYAKKQLAIVKDLFKKSDYIISATDADREGELIFAYVYEFLGVNKPYKKVVMDSQTKDGLQSAFKKLKSSDEIFPIEQAGRGRSIADWVVGINVSSVASLSLGQLLTFGRVQTPTLNLLVQREKEIQNFVSKPFWKVQANFSSAKGDFSADNTKNPIATKEEAKKILSKIQGKDGIVRSVKQEEVNMPVPLLYNITTLQSDANKLFGFTASETLDIVQGLYDNGFTTYPRTASQHLTEDMKGTVDQVLSMLSSYSDEYRSYIEPVKTRQYSKRHYDTSKVESHYAIIPTSSVPKNLSDREKKVYDLIAKSLIRTIYKNAKAKNTTILIDVDDEEFKATGKVITLPEWTAVRLSAKKIDDDELPDLISGDNLKGEYDVSEGKTKPPSRYTDSSLLSAMRTAGKMVSDADLRKIMSESGDGGIGTSATRGAIIETIISRKYAKREKKYIIPTELGIAAIDMMPLEEIKSPELTAHWEKMLSDIEKGKTTLDEFIKDVERETAIWVKKLQDLKTTTTFMGGNKSDKNIDTNLNCPICGEKVLAFDWGYCCSNKSKEKSATDSGCSFAMQKEILSAKISLKILEEILVNKKTKKELNFITVDKKTGDKKKFKAYLGGVVEDGEFKLKFYSSTSTDLSCPKCGSKLYDTEKSMYCSNKDCNFVIWTKQNAGGKTLSFDDKKDIICNGATKYFKFKSKKGFQYSARYSLDENKDVFFEFEKKGEKSDR